MKGKRLRVERIGPKTTLARLRVAFETVGKVDKIELHVNKENGMRDGTAFVSFMLDADASRAITVLNGTNLEDHEITVRWAHESDHPRRQR